MPLTSPKGQASSPDAFDAVDCEALPSTRVVTDLSFLPAPLAPEGLPAALQGAYVPIDSPIHFDAFRGASAQMLQAGMSHTDDVDPIYGIGHRLGPGPAQKLQGRVPNTVIGSFGSNKDVSGSID